MNFSDICSNSQIKATTSESLNRRSTSLIDDSRFKSLLGFSLHLLSSLLLIVLSLHVLQFSCKSLNLILVLIHLSLIHVQLSCHCLHLAGLLLQVLLIDGELLSYLWAWLTGKEVLQFDVELLFFLNDDILFDDFFSLLDQSSLEGHDLLKHFPSIWVSTFKLSPSVAVERILKLLRQSFDLKSFSQKLSLKIVNFLSQIWNLGGL